MTISQPSGPDRIDTERRLPSAVAADDDCVVPSLDDDDADTELDAEAEPRERCCAEDVAVTPAGRTTHWTVTWPSA